MTIPSIAISEPAGPAGAPLLILGPSLGTSTILWDAAADILRVSHRVAAWDLPGHGHSPAAHATFTVRDIALGVLNAVSTLGEQVFRYAGVSLGGAVGLEMMLASPQRVAAAAVICSGARIGKPESWLERARIVRAEGTASLVAASAGRWFAPGSMERRPVIAGRLLHSLRDADDESYALCADALAGYDVRGELASIATPVLAVWGEHDSVTPEASSVEIAGGLRHGSVERIEGAAHLAPAEEPVRVATVLTDFFERAK